MSLITLALAPVYGMSAYDFRITGPAFRYSAEKVEAMHLPLLRAGLELSGQLGGRTVLLAAAHRAMPLIRSD